MAFYGLGTRPILINLRKMIPSVSQVWFADDATGAGTLRNLRTWWDAIKREGVKFGYHVKPTKSWLIVKNEEKHDEAQELFHDSPINITVEGKRHLGAAIGSPQFKEEYINEKVNKWALNIATLSTLATTYNHWTTQLPIFSFHLFSEEH